MLTELNEVLDRLKQGPSQSPERVETSDSSGYETDTSKWCRKILSEKTFLMKNLYRAIELGRFLTGPSDAANKSSHFYCWVCRKNVSLLTHGHYEVLRHFQGSRHFAGDQCLRLETPGWRVLDFHGKLFSKDELERQRGKNQESPLWWVTVSIGLRRIWSLMGLVLLTRSCQFSQKCLAWWIH